MPPTINIMCTDDALSEDALECTQRLNTPLNQSQPDLYTLSFAQNGVSLLSPEGKCVIRVDFCEGKAAHRRLYGGGKGQMIAKAVGLSSKIKPSVFDATAGLGNDAFVLASLGCEVTLMERSPVSFYLLKDGLRRGQKYGSESDSELMQIFSRMHLKTGDSIEFMATATSPVADVIYLDPMFPARQKKAAVKKEMKAFHDVVGQDIDAESLFVSAQHKAKFRIAVKRPRLAPEIGDLKPNYSLDGKSSRFDIYTYKSMTNGADY